MADDISVQISAQISQLQSGLSEATNALKQFVGTVEDGMNKATSAGEGFGGKLETALNLGVFLELEEVAKQALEAVEQAFEATIGKAEEFGLSNAKFAKIIGVSVEQATGLSEALQGVGVSTEQYEGLALRLGQRIGTNEKVFQSFGIATRDANGELLGGKAAMDAIFDAMRANPAQENSIAFAAFGRQAKAAFDIMRAGNEDADNLNNILKSMGVQTGDTSAQSAQLENELNQMRVAWDGIWIAIGQRAMPIFEDFIKWMEGPGQSTVHGFATGVGVLIDIIVVLGAIFLEVGEVIGGIIAEMLDWFVGWGEVWYDVVTGNFSAAATRAKGVFTDLGDTFTKTVTNMKATAQGAGDIISKLAAPPPKQDAVGAYGAVNGQNAPVTGTNKPDDGKAAEMARKIADEQLAAAEKEALEEVKIAEDKNNTLFALGQITVDEFVKQQSDLEDQKYNIQLDFLQKKAQADQKDALAHLKDLDAIKLLTETHEEALLKIHDAALIKKQAMDRQDLEDGIKLLQEDLTDKKAELDEEYKQGRISMEEKTAAERQLTLAVEQEILKRLDDEIAGLKPGTEAWKTAMKERENIVRQFTNDVKKLDNDLVNDQMQKWKTLGNSIKSSFNGALNGMLTGTESWQQALGQIIDGIANAFLTMGENMLEDWIAQQIEKEIFTKTSNTASALGQISAAAGVAGANAYAATAAIPYVGPELAPGAAATAVAATLSFSSLAVAEKGMVLDEDRLVSAHKEEMILPAPLSRGIQDMIGKGKGDGGDVHFNYQPTVNAPEQKSLRQMLDEDASDMLAWIQTKHRDGSLRLR